MIADTKHPLETEIHNESLISGDLGFGILTVEDEEGHYEPIGIASSLVEADELTVGDFNRRSPEGDDLCPYRYALFVRGAWGKYELAASWNPSRIGL